MSPSPIEAINQRQQVQPVKIQINSLEALERLIGGDSELEIEIRNSVIQNFANKHLKPIANSAPVVAVVDNIRKEILKEVSSRLMGEIATFKSIQWNGRLDGVKLHADILQLIERTVKGLVDKITFGAVEKAVADYSAGNTLETIIQKQFEYYTEQTINTEIKKRLDALKAKL